MAIDLGRRPVDLARDDAIAALPADQNASDQNASDQNASDQNASDQNDGRSSDGF
jgi:hypothetical protein